MEFDDCTSAFMNRMDKACKKDYFQCKGVTSQVYTGNSTYKHVVMIDSELNSFEKVRQEVDQRFNHYFIFRSSKDGFHVINPVLRPKYKVYEILSNISIEDDKHREIGYKRGDWVLRADDKPNKHSPRLVYSEVYPDDYNSFSRPHLEYLRVIHNSRDAELLLKNPTEGNKLKYVKYWTFK